MIEFIASILIIINIVILLIVKMEFNKQKVIKGHCVTELRNYSMVVSRFYEIPKLGDKVLTLKNGYESTLKVKSINHHIDGEGLPYIIVTLNN